MATVRLDLVSPANPNVVALRVYESSEAAGPYSQVDRTVEVGSYPAYISSYSTTLAMSTTDWFYVGWEDDAGNIVSTSQPVKVGAPSLVEQVVERVLQRDAALDRYVVTQEAEVAVEDVFPGQNPYDVAAAATYKQLGGLVYLTMARCYVFGDASDDTVSLGLVRMQQSAHAQADVQKLLDLASASLGLNQSRILQMRHRHHHYVFVPDYVPL